MKHSTAPPAPAPEPVELLTTAEVAERLHTGREHVRRLIRAKVLPAVSITSPGARRPRWRVRSDDLALYIEGLTRSTELPAERSA